MAPRTSACTKVLGGPFLALPDCVQAEAEQDQDGHRYQDGALLEVSSQQEEYYQYAEKGDADGPAPLLGCFFIKGADAVPLENQPYHDRTCTVEDEGWSMQAIINDGDEYAESDPDAGQGPVFSAFF